MRNRRNYYRLLQVQPDAPIEIIRASFRTLMRDLKQHPDLGGSTGNAALLIEAYETLSDPMRRAAYDDRLPARYNRKAARSPSLENIQPINDACLLCGKTLTRIISPGDHCQECGIPLQSPKQPTVHHSTKRSLDRIKRNEKIFYWSAWPQKPREARMNDLSPRGMGLLCKEHLGPGTILKISGPYILASAVVTNIRDEMKEGERLYLIGVRFLAVDFQKNRGNFISVTG